jgi:hypothetical protein
MAQLNFQTHTDTYKPALIAPHLLGVNINRIHASWLCSQNIQVTERLQNRRRIFLMSEPRCIPD